MILTGQFILRYVQSSNFRSSTLGLYKMSPLIRLLTPNLYFLTQLTNEHFELSPVAQAVSQAKTQSLCGPDNH